MEYIPVVILVGCILTLLGIAINEFATKVSENPRWLAVIAVLALFVFVLLGGLAYAEETGWQNATVNGSVEIESDGETSYLVVYTTDDGYVLTYFDDCNITKGTRIRVNISPAWETIDAELIKVVKEKVKCVIQTTV